MVSIDRVTKTLLMFTNSDVRGNISPTERQLAINDTVNEIYESYFPELTRLVNRENRGLINGGLENITDRLREKLLQFLIIDQPLVYDVTTTSFNLPDDWRYYDTAEYEGNDFEFAKNSKSFKLIKNCVDTTPTANTPVALQYGSKLKVAPATIVDGVTLSYLRKPVIANWTYMMIDGAELFNPDAPDFRDIDLHSSEENNLIIKTLFRLGINLKEQDLVAVTQNKSAQEFNQDNSL